MVFHIVIAGQSQCEMFIEACMIADYLSQNLPIFCYKRIEKSVLDWEGWLKKINQKNKWHHTSSPLIWKELLMKGSKPYYIGGTPDFLDYCYSYYQFETFMSHEQLDELASNFTQFKCKCKNQQTPNDRHLTLSSDIEQPSKKQYVVCISGTCHSLSMHLISGLLEMCNGINNVCKIYIYEDETSRGFMENVERECSYVSTDHTNKVVKYVEKIGIALTHTDLLIILDHVAFDPNDAIGDWLQANKKLMENLAYVINASAAADMRILFPNLGPACYNATILRKELTKSSKQNIVVATSDLGLEIAPFAADIAGIPQKNMYCPPVWGFVGVNHLVDIATAIHKYNSFDPYKRFVKIRNSTLDLGVLTPEMRTMECLMYWDDTLWTKVAESKKKQGNGQVIINKAVATLNVIRSWIIEPNQQNIVNLGVLCNGSFGLQFDGFFSQPSRLINGTWWPASDYLLPKDRQMKISYLEQMAELTMNLEEKALPKITPYYPCYCKRKLYHKKGVW